MTRRRSKLGISRRQFVRTGSMLAASAAVYGPFESLLAQQALFSRRSRREASPYGSLRPARDETTGLELLKLPPDFTFRSVGWAGEPMEDGSRTPNAHDGMGVVYASADGEELVLMRNHERGPTFPGDPVPVVGVGSAPVYDAFRLPGLVAGMGGGTTALTFREGRLVSSRATLAGTLVNCAGGPTPWGSWLTCEEFVIRGSLVGARDHGYVFEVPPPAHAVASARPIRDLGFMKHEACAVDPETGFVYETEDNGPNSGFYRFRPHDTGRQLGALEEGGTLEMLKVRDVANLDLRSPRPGDGFPVEWVEIENPDANPGAFDTPNGTPPPIVAKGKSGPYIQGELQGAARFSRLEGCWYHDDVIYFVDTNGGAASKGVLWAYEPPEDEVAGNGWLTAVFVSPNEMDADQIDNVTLSPRGGILACEDGGGVFRGGTLISGTRLVGIGRDGTSFAFAENHMRFGNGRDGEGPGAAAGDYRGREFAGACFSPCGRWLFVNVQTPGVTLVIEGPWERGPL